jgi:hypothetical protein
LNAYYYVFGITPHKYINISNCISETESILKNRGTKRDGGVVGELEGGEDTENPAGPSPPSAPVSCHKIIWQDSPIVNMIGQIYINGLDLSNTEHF